MNNFLTALQFLTRIKIIKQTSWRKDAFALSVPWFPLVGAIIGLLLALAGIVLMPVDALLRAVILVILEIIITGGLFCDGLMDTADGVFSGREKERMLEIMKDSRIGANGILAFVSVVLLKIALYNILDSELLPLALFAMPVVTRLSVVYAISFFPYAREKGIGGMFSDDMGKPYAALASVMTMAILIPTFSPAVYIAALVCLAYALLIMRYISGVLGGLTGDTYGFIAETGNAAFLLAVYIIMQVYQYYTGGTSWLI